MPYGGDINKVYVEEVNIWNLKCLV
jgi:hypothetical protein